LSAKDLINSRLRAVAVVVLAWAAIYLPALGSIAIKGEEGRRILPAVRMLETGDYIVPQVGGSPYYRKPPLVNWLVAASFKIVRARNEWTARLPSALSVLAVAIAFVTVARTSLGAGGSIIAALIWMTNIGIIEKGRLIEIEALYVSLCGLAIIFWLSFFLQKKSPWLIWLPASVFLGLGLLAKVRCTSYFFMESFSPWFCTREIGGFFSIPRTSLRSPSCSGSRRRGRFRSSTARQSILRWTSGLLSTPGD
jgi:4-amino-4-deoxy-L-arabinose transferase-like glycosyltransferase